MKPGSRPYGPMWLLAETPSTRVSSGASIQAFWRAEVFKSKTLKSKADLPTNLNLTLTLGLLCLTLHFKFVFVTESVESGTGFLSKLFHSQFKYAY